MKMNLRRLVFLFMGIMWCAKITNAQTTGCTDFRANNYNQNATINDGSCLYNSTSVSPFKLIDKLSDTISETSGVIVIDGELWTIGDSGNPNALYHFDKTSGAILQTIFVSNAVNIDWEEITADDNYIYIGDFGNNNGNRTNLSVYKINLSHISTKTVDSVSASIINFSYTDQTSHQRRRNANRYDCEAMFVWNDTLHLFSKDWVEGHTKHYLLSTVPGTYAISPVDSLDAGCLITGAGINSSSKRVVLIGYSKTGSCSLWLLWDFQGSAIFSGNKRRMELGFFTNIGQTESVCFNDSNNIYITNEKVANFVNSKLYAIAIGTYMNPKIAGSNAPTHATLLHSVRVFPDPTTEFITLDYTLLKPSQVACCIYDVNGKLVYCNKSLSNGGVVNQKIDISILPKGAFTLLLQCDKYSSEKVKFIKQ